MKARLDGFSKRLTREYNERAWLAWHVAALSRTKQLPKLEKMLAGREPRRKSWQEQLAAVISYDKRINGRMH